MTWHSGLDRELNATYAVLQRFGKVSKYDIPEEAGKMFDALVKEGMAQFDHSKEVWRPL